MESTRDTDRRRSIGRCVPAVALMALIWWLSSKEDVGPDLGAWARVATSAVHFAQFALLFALWRWGLGSTAIAAAIALFWAGMDEIHQSWVPGRDADPIDFVVDAAGIATAALAVRVGGRLAGGRRRRRSGATGPAGPPSASPGSTAPERSRS